MSHVDKKKENGSWFSLLKYPRIKHDILKKNISLLGKIGANNIELYKAEMRILLSSFVLYRDVIRLLGVPESCEKNKLSLLQKQGVLQIPDDLYEQLIKSKVTIIPQQYTMHGEKRTLFIFPNDSTMNRFQENLRIFS